PSVSATPPGGRGVASPAARDRPRALEPLARRQGIELRDTSWHDDVKRLIRRLEGLHAEQEGAREAPAETAPARPRGRRRLLLIAGAVAVLAAAAAGIAIALVGGGSSGGSSGNSAAEQQLLATIPAVTRPTCHSIDYGDPAARAAVRCAGTRVSVNYSLFPDTATMQGWYTQQRETARVAPGSGSCTKTSFRGEGTRPGGKYFCYVESDGEAYLVWTDTAANVGAVANV